MNSGKSQEIFNNSSSRPPELDTILGPWCPVFAPGARDRKVVVFDIDTTPLRANRSEILGKDRNLLSVTRPDGSEVLVIVPE